jgi:tRNA G10  N-methylase Trm11
MDAPRHPEAAGGDGPSHPHHHGDVYDPFLGSGTTLIVADKLGRRCFGMELDPRYVDVAVARWEAFTGGTAVKVDAATAEAA